MASRANWGSSQDLSGLFGSLVGQYENRLESDTQRALTDTANAQAAKDSDMQSKWTNGEVSDESWINYLRQRVADSAGDPTELEKWQDALRQNVGAIADAQIETKFQLGRVTIGALLSHYRTRMAGLETNSPAYRELAGRYAQLSDSASQVGGSYRAGSGGSRSSSSSSSRSSASGGSGGGGGVSTPTTTPSGFDITGPDVITPDSVLTGTEDGSDYINDLEADKERFKSINTFIKQNPDATEFHDDRTGDVFPLDKDTLLALDKQNIRNNNLRAAYWFGQGNDSKGSGALDDNTYFISGAMTDHNTLMTADARREMQQNVVDQLMASSMNPDPQSRMQQIAKLAKSVGDFNKKIYMNTRVVGKTKAVQGADAVGVQGMTDVTQTTSKAPEEMPDADSRAADMGLQAALEVISDPGSSPEQISDTLNQIFEKTPSLGAGGSSINFQALLEGPQGDTGTNDLPADYIGPLQTRTQAMGLLYADDPNYDGPRYVYAMDGGKAHVAEAEIRELPSAGGINVPMLMPKGADDTHSFQTRQKINGQTVTVWAPLEPLSDPAYQVYRLKKAQNINGTDFKAGQAVPSSVIAKVGLASIRTLVGSGVLEQQSTVEGIQMPDGTTWYRDPEGGEFYHGKLPATTHADSVTGGLFVGDDGTVDVPAFASFAKGVPVPFGGDVSQREMQSWIMSEAANGRINPDDYRDRNESGGTNTNPIDLNGRYLSAAQGENQQRAWAAAQMTAARDSAMKLADEQEQERQATAKEWTQTNLTAQERNRWKKLGVDPQQWAVDRLQQFGSDIGLNMTPTINNDFPSVKQRKEAALAPSPRESAMQAVEMRRQRDSLQKTTPRFAPLPVRRVEGADLPGQSPAINPVVRNDVKIPAPVVDRSYIPPVAVPPQRKPVEGADMAPKPKTTPYAPGGKTAPAPQQTRPSGPRRGGFQQR